MKQSNKKTPFVFKLGIVLLCALLFSFHLTGGLYARYTTSAGGSDGARVAKFDVVNQISSKPVDVDLNFYDPNKLEDSFDFTVQSSSEVAVKYDVVVTVPAGQANYEWLVVTLDGKMPTSQSGNAYTFSDVYSFDANANPTKAHTLKFKVADAYVGRAQGITDITDGEIVLTVHAEQID